MISYKEFCLNPKDSGQKRKNFFAALWFSEMGSKLNKVNIPGPEVNFINIKCRHLNMPNYGV